MNTTNVIPFTREAPPGVMASERYGRMYAVAERLLDFAETVGLAGVFCGGVLIVAATIAYQFGRVRGPGLPSVSIWLIALAILAVLASRLWRKFFLALGNLFEATIDSAVNTSPFLSDSQRADLIVWFEGKTKSEDTLAKTA